MAAEDGIEAAVFETMRRYVPRHRIIFKDHLLVQHLRLLSDDLTAIALDLEKKFQTRIPPTNGNRYTQYRI